MATFVALLRAVNVGGTGKLPMAALTKLCTGLGFRDVRTYIASGNVVFATALSAPKVKAAMEAALADRLGKPAQVLVRTAAELEAIVEANPFPDAAPNQLIVLFLDAAPPAGALKAWPIPGREQLRINGRELYIHYPDGQGRSKLKVPFADVGTGRNLSTVRTLLAMARGDG